MRVNWAKIGPSVATIGAAAVLFLNASVQNYVTQHPSYSIPLATLWGLALHWAQSPRTT